METNRRAFLSIVPVVLASACGDTFVDITNPIQPSPTSPTTRGDVVEFRVTGDSETLQSVLVRMQNGLDGLSQISTVLPYSQSVPLGTTLDTVFLSLDARAFGYGFLYAAIFVNGVIFREASSVTPTPFVSVSGTYRRAR